MAAPQADEKSTFRTKNLYAAKDDAYFANARADIKPLIPPNVSRVLEIGRGHGGTMRMIRIDGLRI